MQNSPPNPSQPLKTWAISHNPTAQRFETRVDGWLCRIDYQLQGEVLHLVHTEVAAAVEGRGVGSSLVCAALQWAQQQSYRVAPRCSFVRLYLSRHTGYEALVV